MNSQKSYEFIWILRIHRHPTNSQKPYDFTEILRIHMDLWLLYFLSSLICDRMGDHRITVFPDIWIFLMTWFMADKEEGCRGLSRSFTSNRCGSLLPFGTLTVWNLTIWLSGRSFMLLRLAVGSTQNNRRGIRKGMRRPNSHASRKCKWAACACHRSNAILRVAGNSTVSPISLLFDDVIRQALVHG